MFKKKPQIKNLSPLRSSDRRKLADQIIADYQIPIPPPQPQPQPSTEQDAAAGSTAVQPSLSSLRSSLLPESTSSARFTTTSGPNASPVSGTVYVGSHPGQDGERILWLQYGKESRLIPTVYSLWHNPNIVPLLHAPDFVVEEKLRGGADMMIPGLVKVKGRKWDARAVKGSIVAVAGINKDTVPVWIGSCEVDVSGLGEDLRGTKGVAVKGIHWEGDEIWNWSAVGKGGQPGPPAIEDWDGIYAGLARDVQNVDLDEDDEDEDEDGQDDGGVSLDKSVGDLRPDAVHDETTAQTSNGDAQQEQTQDEEEEREPTTKEIDDAFHQAFLFAVHTAKKQNTPPHYGFDFPLQASFLIANMVQPHLRFPNQHYTIKKTSWKNTKKFIKHLDKQVLVKSKDRNGGETVILDIDFDDQQVKNFQPYKLPKPKPKDGANGDATAATSGGDSSLNQKLSIQTVYRASSKLVPDLLSSKTQFYTAQSITTALKTYIEANPNLTQGVSVSRNIKLDPFIANNILSPSQDSSALRSGEIDRGALNKRLLEDDHLLTPYHVILRNDQTFDPASPDPHLKPKAGLPPKVNIIIEKRTGTKVVTKISNLEPFHLNPLLLTPELQKKCAGSASVGQLVGGKPGMMEIVVQGDQRDVVVRDVLRKRGVDSRWIEVVDKTKKGKGKS